MIGHLAIAGDDRETTAHRLRPWAPPPDDDARDPMLADGDEASVDLATGMTFSQFTVWSPSLVETGEVGRYVSSSKTQAVSLEAIEKLDVVFDGVTPQFGLVGAGLRRIGRQRASGIRALNYERISAGLALLSRGSSLRPGVGAGISGGSLGLAGSGLSLSADVYFFDHANLTGADTLVVISLGYTFSPYANTHRRSALEPVHPVEVPAPSVPVLDTPCSDVETALVVQRRRAVDACNAARADASHVEACNRASDAVQALDGKAPRMHEGRRCALIVDPLHSQRALIAGGWVCEGKSENPCPGALTCDVDVADVCCPFGL